MSLDDQSNASKPLHLKHGTLAESTACDWLSAKGFVIVARNVRYRFGEIDIIAKDKEILCFIEVRSRKNTQFGTPQASIRTQKKAKLIKAAALYLKQNYKRLPFCRFDVIAVTGYYPVGNIEYIPNAFELTNEPRQRRGSPWQVY
jgi:putative endonuclease